MKMLNLIWLFWAICLIKNLPVLADSTEEYREEYRFERLWPLLPQAWYFNEPLDVAIGGDGKIYVADTGNNLVKGFTSNGYLINQWQWKLDGNILVEPKKVVVSSDNNIYVLYRKEYSDDRSQDYLVRVFRATGDLITGNDWEENDRKVGNSDLAIDSQNNVYITNVLVSDNQVEKQVIKFTPNGQRSNEWTLEEIEGDDPGGALHIAIDRHDDIYIADEDNKTIQKYQFAQDDLILIPWGNQEKKVANLSPKSIAVDKRDNVYVTNKQDHHILKFDSEGNLLAEFHDEREELVKLRDIAANFPLAKLVKMVDDPVMGEAIRENLISPQFKVFDKYFQTVFFMLHEDKEVFLPTGIAIDSQDHVYVTYNFPKNSVQKYTPQCQKGEEDKNECTVTAKKYLQVNQWAGNHFGKEFYIPFDITRDNNNNLYMTDGVNHQVLKFSPEGQLLDKWGEPGNKSGQFLFPSGIAVDTEQGNIYVYVVDTGNARIQKFDDQGKFITEWGHLHNSIDNFLNQFTSENSLNQDTLGLLQFLPNKEELVNWLLADLLNQKDDSGFVGITGIAVDTNHDVYVVDTLLRKVKKFTSEGQFKDEFGNQEIFNVPLGIATDNNNHIYVADYYDHNVKKLTSDGRLLTQWGSEGTGEGEFKEPNFIATTRDLADGKIYVYVADSENRRIQKFDSKGQFMTKWGKSGNNYGQFSQAGGLTVGTDGKVYVTDLMNNRIQVFNKKRFEGGKAIIVAGGDKETNDYLWNSTQMAAKVAHASLIYQGFTEVLIYYFSDDDNYASVDAKPTLEKLEEVITQWASDDNLTLYLVDHGGDEIFYLNNEETLSATDLNQWLNNATGRVNIIYDACQSGSFVPILSQGKNRVIITSASADQAAYFNAQGALSFSNHFWSHVLYGIDIAGSFKQAAEAVDYLQGIQTLQQQTPLLEANGNGEPLEAEDFNPVKNKFIGNGTTSRKGTPVIEEVSPLSQTLQIKAEAKPITATITAIVSDSEDDNLITVWAVVRSPQDIERTNTDEAVIELPSFELHHAGENFYQGSYDGFDTNGTYKIAVFARDNEGNTAIPKTVTVYMKNPFEDKAIIIAGDSSVEIQQNTEQAYLALLQQSYSDDRIDYLSNLSGRGVDRKVTLEGIWSALAPEVHTDTQNLVLYMIGWGTEESFMLNNGTEALSFTKLHHSLQILEKEIRGHIIIIYESPDSGYLLDALKNSSTTQSRIVITSSGINKTNNISCSNLELWGNFSFSQFFWQTVLKGVSNVHQAFVEAKRYVRKLIGERWISITLEEKEIMLPQIDSNGNGIANEKKDDQTAANYKIGTAVFTAKNEPVIGAISEEQYLDGKTTIATLGANNIMPIGSIKEVWANIIPPCNANESTTMIELLPNDKGEYQREYDRFFSEGTYKVTIYAKDTQGSLSLPKRTYVHQAKIYRDGEKLERKLPSILPDAHFLYMVVKLPDGNWFNIQGFNKFVPFNPTDIQPVKKEKDKIKNEIVVDLVVNDSFPRGEYQVYSLSLSQDKPLQLPLDEDTTQQISLSIFYVE